MNSLWSLPSTSIFYNSHIHLIFHNSDIITQPTIRKEMLCNGEVFVGKRETQLIRSLLWLLYRNVGDWEVTYRRNDSINKTWVLSKNRKFSSVLSHLPRSEKRKDLSFLLLPRTAPGEPLVHRGSFYTWTNRYYRWLWPGHLISGSSGDPTRASGMPSQPSTPLKDIQATLFIYCLLCI